MTHQTMQWKQKFCCPKFLLVNFSCIILTAWYGLVDESTRAIMYVKMQTLWASECSKDQLESSQFRIKFHLLHTWSVALWNCCWSSSTGSQVASLLSQPSLGVKLLSSLYLPLSSANLHSHLLRWPWTATKAHWSITSGLLGFIVTELFSWWSSRALGAFVGGVGYCGTFKWNEEARTELVACHCLPPTPPAILPPCLKHDMCVIFSHIAFAHQTIKQYMLLRRQSRLKRNTKAPYVNPLSTLCGLH